jgi:hypothetical protein
MAAASGYLVSASVVTHLAHTVGNGCVDSLRGSGETGRSLPARLARRLSVEAEGPVWRMRCSCKSHSVADGMQCGNMTDLSLQAMHQM